MKHSNPSHFEEILIFVLILVIGFLLFVVGFASLILAYVHFLSWLQQ